MALQIVMASAMQLGCRARRPVLSSAVANDGSTSFEEQSRRLQQRRRQRRLHELRQEVTAMAEAVVTSLSMLGRRAEPTTAVVVSVSVS